MTQGRECQEWVVVKISRLEELPDFSFVSMVGVWSMLGSCISFQNQ